MMVVMAIVTTAMTAPLLHWVYPASQFGGNEAAAKGEHGRSAYSILAPVSLPQSGPALARIAAHLFGAARADAKLLALHLKRPEAREAFRGEVTTTQNSDHVLAPLLREAEGLKIHVEPISFATRDVARDIAAVANAHAADLVLIGFHQPVIGQTILGGVVHRILEESQRDVAILVDRGVESTRRILVPFLGSIHDRLALELAGRLARSMEAQLTVLHVVHPTDHPGTLGAKEQVDRLFADPALQIPVAFKVIVDSSPVQAVIRESPNHDLVVLGVAEEFGLESRPVRLRPERIARECAGSLLIVRKAAKENAP
jgi:nucleotide-binding universal stress UspA family protein